MSCPSPNDSIKKKENDELEDEDKNIAKYILELKNEETRNEAIKNLFCYYMKHEELGKKISLFLWYSGGTIAVLLQELIKLYQCLSQSKKISDEAYNKTIHVLYLFQCLASNSQTRKELIESGILVFVFPFLSISANSKKSYKIKIAALSILYNLLERFDIDTFNFLKDNEIIMILIKFIVYGKEFDKSIACRILFIIISNITGLEYLCEVKERLQAATISFKTILMSNYGLKLKKTVLKILLSLTENLEAKKMIRKELSDIFKNGIFYQNLDESSKDKAKQLEKILQETEQGGLAPTSNDCIKIQKLKNDLTNNSSKNMNNNFKNKKNETNNIHNLNLMNNNSFNSFNSYNNGNQKQMNLNSGDYNNKLNINMMFINNINQVKMTNGFMMPQVGDYNINKDSEGYMNPNMYNQNSSNGFGNMNYYNSYKNA